MENTSLASLSFTELTALRNQINREWDNQYEAAIREVITTKLPNGDMLYVYSEKAYLATKLPNGHIRLFHAEDVALSHTKRTVRYKRGTVAKSEIAEGFYGIRRMIRFNDFSI